MYSLAAVRLVGLTYPSVGAGLAYSYPSAAGRLVGLTYPSACLVYSSL